MTFLRSILADLREKRLWPVALLLVVLLVAAPVLLSMGGDPAEPAAQVAGVPAGSASAAAIAAEVTLDTSKPKPQQRPGALRDPFRPRRASATRTTTGTSAPAAPATSSASSAEGSSGSSSTPSASASAGSGAGASSGSTPSGTSSPAATTPTTPTTTTPATTTTAAKPPVPPVPAARQTLQVDLRFNEVGGTAKRLPAARPDALRLAPLPSAAEPTVVYLGILEDRKTAAFLLSGAAAATGEGHCVPRPGDCQALEVPVGGTEYLDMGDAGAPRQFELGVERTRIKSWSTAKAAAQVRDRRSRAGLQVIRDAIATHEPGLAFYRADARTGLLKRLHPGATK